MSRQLPFASHVRQPAAWQATAAGALGPDDILIVNRHNVRVCHVDTATGSLGDGPVPLALCCDDRHERPVGLVDGLRVTQVGGVLMLRVE